MNLVELYFKDIDIDINIKETWDKDIFMLEVNQELADENIAIHLNIDKEVYQCIISCGVDIVYDYDIKEIYFKSTEECYLAAKNLISYLTRKRYTLDQIYWIVGVKYI